MNKFLDVLAVVVVFVAIRATIAVGVVLGSTVSTAVGGLGGIVLGVMTFLGYARVVDGILAVISPGPQRRSEPPDEAAGVRPKRPPPGSKPGGASGTQAREPRGSNPHGGHDMPRCLKVMELVAAVLAGLAAVGAYACVGGPNAAEFGWAWMIGWFLMGVVFQIYAQNVILDALFGRDGLVWDFPDWLERRDAAREAKFLRTLPVGRRGMLARHSSPRIRRRRMAAR